MDEPNHEAKGYCRNCSHFAATGSNCELRRLVIPEPELTGCASHPQHGPLRRPFPIGPVVHTANGNAGVHQPSPDDRAIRERLLELIEDIKVRGTQPLSARETIVVWQLREFGEPRAFHHIDRIDAAMVINRARADGKMLPALTLFGTAQQIVAATMPELAQRPPARPHEFLLQYSLAGRLLLLSTILVGAAAFAGLLLAEASLWRHVGRGEMVLHFGVLGAIAALFAALWMWA
ncbi:MAG: hypothetical protein ABIP94_05055, partial [Planctomycetota bacterium]